MNITGASAWDTRTFDACGPYQWARRFLKNSLEAQANRIDFGIEWLAAQKFIPWGMLAHKMGCGS